MLPALSIAANRSTADGLGPKLGFSAKVPSSAGAWVELGWTVD